MCFLTTAILPRKHVQCIVYVWTNNWMNKNSKTQCPYITISVSLYSEQLSDQDGSDWHQSEQFTNLLITAFRSLAPYGGDGPRTTAVSCHMAGEGGGGALQVQMLDFLWEGYIEENMVNTMHPVRVDYITRLSSWSYYVDNEFYTTRILYILYYLYTHSGPDVSHFNKDILKKMKMWTLFLPFSLQVMLLFCHIQSWSLWKTWRNCIWVIAIVTELTDCSKRISEGHRKRGAKRQSSKGKGGLGRSILIFTVWLLALHYQDYYMFSDIVRNIV